MPSYRYLAIKYCQAKDGSPIFLFSAPCHEVTDWAGIPRKELRSGIQTVGFQRAPNPTRLKKIGNFLDDSQNVIANPILCAVRNSSRVTFETITDSGNRDSVGWVTIEEPDYKVYSLVDLLKAVETLLLERLPHLDSEIQISDEEVAEFCRGSQELTLEDEIEDEDETREELDIEQILGVGDLGTEEDSRITDDESVEFSSESHIQDFFRAIRLRRLALEYTNAKDREKFSGFSKEALIEYLHAATVVDGQHRLLGAQAQFEELMNSEEVLNWQDEILNQGESADKVLTLTQERFSRYLGVALVCNDDWAEHVFQFVVVNQKSARIPKDLLGSIISTTLTDEEVNRITERLGRADIQVVDYRTIAFLETSSESPFQGLIKRGYDDKEDVSKRLDWSVVEKLANVFRNLRGGKLFHQKDIDYANNWKKQFLHKSKILGDCDPKLAYEIWGQADGPWRVVFCQVWTVVRNKLSTVDDDPEIPNVWGYPRNSNIFNGTHLLILAADFFAFVFGRGYTFNSISEVEEISANWLDGAKSAYFARDWDLKGKGVKKSEIAIKRLWSENWYTYRMNGYSRIPPVRNFRP